MTPTNWAEPTPTPKLLKQMMSMYDLVDMFGIDVDEAGNIESPWSPGERSCHVYPDGVYCFPTKQHADIIDLARLFAPDWSFNQTVLMLFRKALRAGREPGDVDYDQLKSMTYRQWAGREVVA